MTAHSCSKRLLERLLWLLLVLPFCSFAAATDFMDQAKRPQSLVAPSAMTLEQAADKVRRETGGRVLSASPVEKGGRRGYDVRVLLDGKRVQKVFVDARSKR